MKNILKSALNFYRYAQEYGYHVTYYRNLSSIESQGLTPQGGGSSIGRGGYAGHSKGKVFFTEEDGIDFWHQRLEENAENISDNPFEDGLAPVVIRFPMPESADIDEAGSEDANADAFMTNEGIDPEHIEVYNGMKWVPIEEWGSIDIESAFEPEEIEEYDGETITVYYFKSDTSLKP